MQLDDASIVDYSNRNQSSGPISAKLLPPFQFIESKEIKALFVDGPRQGWQRMLAVHGKDMGLIVLSLPAYSRHHDVAVLTYSYDDGPLSGQTDYVILRRNRGVWRIIETRNLVLS